MNKLVHVNKGVILTSDSRDCNMVKNAMIALGINENEIVIEKVADKWISLDVRRDLCDALADTMYEYSDCDDMLLEGGHMLGLVDMDEDALYELALGYYDEDEEDSDLSRAIERASSDLSCYKLLVE